MVSTGYCTFEEYVIVSLRVNLTNSRMVPVSFLNEHFLTLQNMAGTFCRKNRCNMVVFIMDYCNCGQLQ